MTSEAGIDQAEQLDALRRRFDERLAVLHERGAGQRLLEAFEAPVVNTRGVRVGVDDAPDSPGDTPGKSI
jgi:hypothetical protein